MLGVANPGESIKAFGIMFLVGLSFMILIDWILRRQLKQGKVIVQVDSTSIESIRFPAKRKRFLWTEISSISFDTVNGVPMLQLQIKPSNGMPDKRSFFIGVNPCRPSLNLSVLSSPDQDRLIAAVNTLYRAGCGGSSGIAPLENHLAAERDFKEKLKALAPRPWATITLVALNIAVWLAIVISGQQFAQLPVEVLLAWGGNAASEVQRGQWWRLVTSIFVHATPMHLLMNMLGLIAAGIMVERIYGWRLYLLIYLGSGLMGSALSMHFAAQSAVSVGASGAIFGAAGALVIAVLQHRKQLPNAFGKQTIFNLGFFIFYSLIQGFGKQGVDNSAHIGGLLAGCLLALILPERFDMTQFLRHWKTRTSIAIFSLAVVIPGLAATAPAATIDQRKAIESSQAFERAYKHLGAELNSLKQQEAEIKAGSLDALAAEKRNQTVHATAMRQIQAELSKVSLSPTDPRIVILPDSIRLTELMAEALEMPTTVGVHSNNPEPADPARIAEIEKELNDISLRIKNWGEKMKKQTGRQ